LRHAQRLIISSARSRLLVDIAVEAGFYDEAHLASHFRAFSLSLPDAGCDSNNFLNSRNSFLFAHPVSYYPARQIGKPAGLPPQS
jgi:hypothetical protein